MPPRVQRGRYLIGACGSVGGESIDDRRFAHAGLADQYGALASKPWRKRRDILPRRELNDWITERCDHRHPIDEPRERGKVPFVRRHDETAVFRFRSDHPPM